MKTHGTRRKIKEYEYVREPGSEYSEEEGYEDYGLKHKRNKNGIRAIDRLEMARKDLARSTKRAPKLVIPENPAKWMVKLPRSIQMSPIR